jgi:hypothetical protein
MKGITRKKKREKIRSVRHSAAIKTLLVSYIGLCADVINKNQYERLEMAQDRLSKLKTILKSKE